MLWTFIWCPQHSLVEGLGSVGQHLTLGCLHQVHNIQILTEVCIDFKHEDGGPRRPWTMGWWWRDTQISRKRLAIRLPAVKSLSTWHKPCQVVNCLLCFGAGMSAFCLKNTKTNMRTILTGLETLTILENIFLWTIDCGFWTCQGCEQTIGTD